MAAIEKRTTIGVSAEKVFAYLADFPRHSEWADVPLKIEQTSDGPVGQGTTFKSVGHQLGRDFEGEVTITEFAPNEKLAFEAKGDAFHFRHHLLLHEEDGRTHLTKGTEPLRLSFPFSLLSPLLNTLILPRGLDADLRRIRAKLEGQATP